MVLLSDTDYHAFHGFTGEFLSGFLSLDFHKTPYQEIMEGVRFIKGRVVQVNQLTQEIIYETQDSTEFYTLAYDELVMGIGSSDKEDTVKGMAQFALGVKKIGALEQCRERILYSLQMAEKASTREERSKYLTFTVVGGGFAAAEICGNLQEYLEKLAAHFPVLKEFGYSLYLIHSGEEFMPQVKKSYGIMRRYSKRMMKKCGVKVLPNARLSEIKEDCIVLADGQVIYTVVPICAIGQKVLPLKSEIPFELSVEGTLVADAQLRAKGFDNIWVGGDIAQVKRPYFKGECRKDALWAIKQGSRIGKNIARKLKGKQPGKFAYPGLGQTAAFGETKAIMELYGLQFIGPLAWVSRICFFLYFMPTRKKALKALLNLFKERELFPKGYLHPATKEGTRTVQEVA